MALGNNRVYRGHRTVQNHLPAILLFVVVLLFLLAIAAFSLLPEYLVYYKDSVEMVVPSLQESGEGFHVDAIVQPEAYAGEVSAQVQVTEPDYTNIKLGSETGLDYLQCYYVDFDKANSAGLAAAVKDAARVDVKGLCIEMKDETGKLAWLSAVDTAASVAANSNWEPSAELSDLKKDGWYLVAEISCAIDTAMATGKEETALRDYNGAIYTDESGSWVDLWNKTVREYTEDLISDLLAIGFDEVILTHVEHPLVDVTYTRDIAAGLSRTAEVMNFAVAVRQAVQDDLTKYSAHLNVRAERELLTTGLSNGQDLDNLLKVFDRIVIYGSDYQDDVACFKERAVDSTLRFVPIMDWSFSGGSWILDYNVPSADE